ncbi:MAG: AAA family ATPase [Solirubrobacteraceae bacterium]
MAGSELQGGTELVGRSGECAVIDRLLDAAVNGQSGALVIHGEAGVGKTALLEYARSRATRMVTLAVAGVEAESELDFAGLHALLRPILGVLTQVPEPQRVAVAGALGLGPPSGSDRFMVSAGVLSVLSAAAEAQPVLCLIDDAQWLDVPSADALVFAARRLDTDALVILFAARDGEQRRFDAPGVEDLVLDGIDEESAHRLLDRAGHEIALSVRERLLAEAAGNPLALIELPGGLATEQLAGRAMLPEAIPLSARLQATFAQRIERLPMPTRAALLLAAAEEASELAIVLRAASALEVPVDALDRAEQADLIKVEAGCIVFRHPLVRSAVYETATSGEVRRAHAALADAYGGDRYADRRLWHRAQATLRPDEAIATDLARSAERSRRRGGYASAATAFERAARLSETDASRGRHLADAGAAAWEAGQVDRARGLVADALLLADRAARAQLLYLSGVIEGRCGRLSDAVAILEQGIAGSDDTSLTLMMLREACDMAMYAGDHERAAALAARANSVPAETRMDRFTAATLSALAAAQMGDHAQAAALSTDAIEIAEQLNNPACLIWAALTVGRELIWGAGLTHATRAVRVARERSLSSILPYALQVQAAQLIGQSQFDLAYSTAEEGHRLALDFGQPWAASWNLADLVIVDALRGDEERALAHIDCVRTLVAKSGASFVSSHIGRALGLLNLALGRPAEALEQLLVPLATRLQSSPLVVLSVPDAIEAAVRCKRLADVADHFDRFRSWARRFPNRARLALLARCEAQVDDAAADEHYIRALELAGSLSPFDRARTQLLYGEWLRRERRRLDARPHLRAALATFEHLAVPPWEARARSELRASGETARKRDPSTRDQLTPQELHIAGLAAGGLTNPEIAARLFLSPRTIDYHVRKILAKLEIASRAELAHLDLRNPLRA